MSKDITIEEGGVAKQLNSIKKIQTAKQGGGTVYWVPEDEARLTTKHINKNGTYKAKDDGYYGYSQVTVSGVGKAIGKKPDGNEYSVETNEQTGELEETVLPSRIEIVTKPTKTEYNDGEDIDITGIVVKAYKNDGEVWEGTGYTGGIIPASELSIEPTKADTSEVGEGSGVGYYNGREYNFWFKKGDEEKAIRNAQVHIVRTIPSDIYVIGGGQAMSNVSEASVNDGYNSIGYLSTTCREVPAYNEKNGSLWMTHTIPSPNSYIDVNGTRVYYQSNLYPTKHPFQNQAEYDAWNWLLMAAANALYGGEGHVEYGQQITVKWNRPKDSKTLTDIFTVAVNEASAGENEGGSGGGSW